MKVLAWWTALLVVTSSRCWGQGQFVFNNRIGTEVNARLIDIFRDPCDGSYSSVGPDWSIQLFGAPLGSPISQLVPLEPPTATFRGPAGSPTAGYVVGLTPTVPNVAPGQDAVILLRLLNPDGMAFDLGPYTVRGLGGATIPPPNLQLGTSPLPPCIPEPSLITFGGVGMLLLVLGRRRRPTPT